MDEVASNASDISRDPGVSSDGEPAQDPGLVQAASAEGSLTSERVLDALRDVYDPELGINIVDLGLVYAVEVEQGVVHVEYTLTTMGCPIGPLIEQQIQALLGRLPGVRGVDAEMVLRPPWSPDLMSDEAKAALGFF